MDTLLLSAIIGVVAGIIDVIPMLIQKLDKLVCISARFFIFLLVISEKGVSLHSEKCLR